MKKNKLLNNHHIRTGILSKKTQENKKFVTLEITPMQVHKNHNPMLHIEIKPSLLSNNKKQQRNEK